MEDPDLQAEFEKVNLQYDYKGSEEVQEELNEENRKTEEILKELGLI